VTDNDRLDFARVKAMVSARVAIVIAMDPVTRNIFLRHRLDGWPYPRIAQAHRISVAEVEGHIAKAIAALDIGLRRHGL